MALTENQIVLFKDDYFDKTGISFDKIFASDNEANAFIKRVYSIVIQYITSNQPLFKMDEVTSEFQKSAIWAAMLEQALYMKTVGDFYLMSGYDPVTGQLTPKAELEKRAFSDLARGILANAGLLYRGITKRNSSLYLEERAYWGRM